MADSIPRVVADFETALDQAVAEGATTAELLSIVDSDGVNLANGYYGFTIDNDTDYKEYIVCQLAGTTLTNILSTTDQGVTSTGFQNYHRRGAVVQITDHVSLRKVVEALTGMTGLNASSPLFYDGAPVGLSGNQIPTVDYVLSVVNGGPVSFTQQSLPSQTAGENLTAQDYIYFKTSDQKWWKVDADVPATFTGTRKAIAGSTVLANATLTVYLPGPVPGFSGLTPGSLYYASGTPGAIVSTIPTIPTYNSFVGVALSATQLYFAPTNTDGPLVGSLGTPSSTNAYLTQENEFTANVDQSQTTQNASVVVGAANTTTNRNKIAQSFIATRIKIRGVSLYKAADTGSFTGTVTVSLQADSAGAPSGSALATVTVTNAEWLTFAVGELSLDFDVEYSQIPGTTYWIVIQTSTADTSNHPNLGINTAGGYANGIVRYNNTTDGWVTIVGNDLYFKTLNGISGQIPYAASKFVLGSILPSGLVSADLTGGTATDVGGEQIVSQKTILNAFDLYAGIKLSMVFSFDTAASSGSTQTMRIKLNGTTVVTITQAANSNNRSYTAQVFILNNGSLSSQAYMYSGLGVGNAVTPVAISGSGTAAATTDNHTLLTITMDSADADNGNAVLYSYIAEKIA